jgi:tyrosine-protein phosphatase YwqE
MINRSVYIQISAPSVIGGYGEKVKRTVWKMLNKGWVHFMGSDHHARNDYEAFFKAREKIVEHIDENMARILTSQHPRSILRDEKVDFSYVMIQRPPKRKFHRRLFRSLGL